MLQFGGKFSTLVAQEVETSDGRTKVQRTRAREYEYKREKKENCQIDCRSIGSEGPFCIRNVVVSLSRLWPWQRRGNTMYFYIDFPEKKKRAGTPDGGWWCMGPETRRKEREKVGVGRMQCTSNVREEERERTVTDQLRRNTNSCRCSTKWRPPLLNLFTPVHAPLNYTSNSPARLSRAPVFPIVPSTLVQACSYRSR